MKLKIENLYELTLALGELADKELPISMAFTVQRNQKIISEELVASDKIRKKLLDKYKEKDLSDGLIKIKDDKIDILNKEMSELMMQEVDLDIKKIKLQDLEKLNITIKPKTLIALDLIAD